MKRNNLICPKCNSINKDDFGDTWSYDEKAQIFICMECGYKINKVELYYRDLFAIKINENDEYLYLVYGNKIEGSRP